MIPTHFSQTITSRRKKVTLPLIVGAGNRCKKARVVWFSSAEKLAIWLPEGRQNEVESKDAFFSKNAYRVGSKQINKTESQTKSRYRIIQR